MHPGHLPLAGAMTDAVASAVERHQVGGFLPLAGHHLRISFCSGTHMQCSAGREVETWWLNHSTAGPWKRLLLRCACTFGKAASLQEVGSRMRLPQATVAGSLQLQPAQLH
jgi:hypothetical protein